MPPTGWRATSGFSSEGRDLYAAAGLEPAVGIDRPVTPRDDRRSEFEDDSGRG
jgi:hypothetical protein